MIQNNVSLKEFNTFHVEATAQQYLEIKTDEDLSAFLQTYKGQQHNHNIVVLGGGSNIVFTKDYTDFVLHIRTKGISVIKQTEEDVYISAAAGEIWDDFVAYCVSHNYGGVENLSGI